MRIAIEIPQITPMRALFETPMPLPKVWASADPCFWGGQYPIRHDYVNSRVVSR